jgi:basic amino acid/polyamine antiporter, APA family
VLVSLGVILLAPQAAGSQARLPRPFVPWFPLISVLLCGGLMFGLTVITWLRFVIWLGLA